MGFSRKLISCPQSQIRMMLDMQIKHNWIIFLSAEGDCMEFGQVEKWVPVCWPIIGHLEVISKIWTEPTWELSSQVGVLGERRLPALKELGKKPTLESYRQRAPRRKSSTRCIHAASPGAERKLED
jgi:hypothetical protein